MEPWSTHHFFKQASDKLGETAAREMLQYITRLREAELPVIFSIGHLGKITGLNYSLLHNTVNRKRESANYNLFSIKKRTGGRRFIHAVNGRLFYLHKFINEEILQKSSPHHSSFAFHQNGGIRRCAEMHCEARWLLKFDLKDFFYSIREPLVYQVFRKLGYKKLLSFELARLCTTTRLPRSKDKYLIHLSSYEALFDCLQDDLGELNAVKPYTIQKELGVLPQGAPTSPMLSNLAAGKLDVFLYNYSQINGFVYTRYADDITLSSIYLPTGKSIKQIQRDVISIIRKSGFIENKDKMRVAGPGAKKLVLGLLIDGETPRISKEMYKRIDRNLYAINKFGLNETAAYEGFESVYGFYNHLSGLLSFVKDVDSKRWEIFNSKFMAIKTPF
jgi:RNA-directed DNA polymerase